MLLDFDFLHFWTMQKNKNSISKTTSISLVVILFNELIFIINNGASNLADLSTQLYVAHRNVYMLVKSLYKVG